MNSLYYYTVLPRSGPQYDEYCSPLTAQLTRSNTLSRYNIVPIWVLSSMTNRFMIESKKLLSKYCKYV